MGNSKSKGAAPTTAKAKTDQTKGKKKGKRGANTLRIIAVNDVYKLAHMASFAALVKDKRASVEKAGGKCIVTLAGDFLSPSILSSMDKGKSMVDVLNNVPVTHVCFGNHEADVPNGELRARIAESKFTWLNTNMPDFDADGKGGRLPEYEIIEVGGHRVALLGLCSGASKLYRTDHGFGATQPSDLAQAARRVRTELVDEKKLCDVVIPMTHQDVDEDIALARELDFPVILGGHDHDVHEGTYDGTLLIKAGADALKAAVIDVTWTSSDNSVAPTVSYELVDLTVKPWVNKTDSNMKKRVARHMQLVAELDRAVIFDIVGDDVLSCERVRFEQTSMGTLLATSVRRSMRADCALLNSGGIRTDAAYTKIFTCGELKRVCPFETSIIVVSMTGRELNEAVKFSRTVKAGVEYGGFLQVDDELILSDDFSVTSVRGSALNEDQVYSVALPHRLLTGMDDCTPLMEFAKRNAGAIPEEEAGLGLVSVIIDAFAQQLWRDIYKNLGDFNSLDLNGDGVITTEEIKAALDKFVEGGGHNLSAAAALKVVDADGDGKIDREEFERGKAAVH